MKISFARNLLYYEESKARDPSPLHREELQDNKSGTVNLRGHRRLNGRRIIVVGRLTRARPNAELINNVVKIHLPVELPARNEPPTAAFPPTFRSNNTRSNPPVPLSPFSLSRRWRRWEWGGRRGELERIFKTRRAPQRHRATGCRAPSLERSPPSKLPAERRGQTRFRRVFFYAERTTFHTDDDTGGNEPLCFPPSLLTTAILFLPPYTRAHPFASLNLHYFNVALCPTLPFLSIGSTRALLNFQFQFLFLLSRLFLFAVHLQTLQSPPLLLLW